VELSAASATPQVNALNQLFDRCAFIVGMLRTIVLIDTTYRECKQSGFSETQEKGGSEEKPTEVATIVVASCLLRYDERNWARQLVASF
jgi:hypothetical protein